MKTTLACGLAGLILACAVTASAETAHEPPGSDLSPGRGLPAFVKSDGRIDLEALRASDFQGPLQLGGANVRIDPVTAEPRVQPSVTSDPDDAHWSNRYSPVLAGLNGRAYALIVYDHKLIAAGGFTVAGATKAMHIAAWDGTSWSPLGPGLDGEVRALTVYGDRLIAGGQFSSAGGVAVKSIAAWDGNSWSALGAGVGGSVFSLAVYDDELIVGGAFVSVADGHPLRNIAAWNGETWTSLGIGVDSGVLSLTVFENRLIAGGYFATAGGLPSTNNIAAWDGASWAPLSGGLDRSVAALCVYDNKLIAGGYTFNNYGVGSGIATWDGTSWQSLAAGPPYSVTALCVCDGELIAGGGTGSPRTGYVSAWDGTSWTTMGSGLDGRVTALSLYGDELIAGGYFYYHSGELSAWNIAAWNHARWSAMPSGTDLRVNALTIYRGRLIAGGAFTSLGGVKANHIAAWDGTHWTPLAAGTDGYVYALSVYGDKLIAGGRFAGAGGVAAANIAAWDGRSWSALEEGIVGTVEALAVYDDELVVGGNIWWTGGDGVSLIAGWDGTSWQALGQGIRHDPDDDEYLEPSAVSALFVHAGRLIAGGNFSTAGGQPAQAIAAWDGASWSALGGGFPQSPPPRSQLHVWALGMYRDRLVAGGSFGLLEWDGANWSAPGAGSVTGLVASLAAYGGRLIVSGYGLSVPGGDPTRQIAAWDGKTWSNLGSGMDAAAIAMTQYQGRLVAGGRFTIAGDQVSAYLAEWSKPAARPTAIGRIDAASRTADAVQEFARFGNSPNPFKRSTQISFDLPEAAHVRLDVFNVLGQRVTTLIDRAMGAGQRSVTWRADQVPPGIYYARLRSGDTVRAWRMMLVR